MVKPMPAFTGAGSEETVDHYEVYVSTDGRKLLDAGAVAVGGAALDLSGSGLAAGTYRVYVQMVGKSHILNRMSPAAAVTLGSPSTQ
jgi:hypothetical protein